MKKNSINALKYAAAYDHQAALTLAYMYAKGDDVARDKYKSYAYYKMYQTLVASHPKPLNEANTAQLNKQQAFTETYLKKVLRLADDMSPTLKTWGRSLYSTNKLRSAEGLINNLRVTLLRIADFIFYLIPRNNVFNKIPFLSTFFAAVEVGLEAGIITKNSVQTVINTANSDESDKLQKISRDIAHSATKDDRLLRMFSSGIWLVICVVSVCITTVAAPLLVAGTLFDLGMQLFQGTRSLLSLRRERQFIDNELAKTNTKINQSVANSAQTNSESALTTQGLNWLQIKAARLKHRQMQIKAAKKVEIARTTCNVLSSSLMLVGAIFVMIPLPPFQLAGFGLIATGGAAFFATKLVDMVVKTNHETAVAMEPKNIKLVETDEDKNVNEHVLVNQDKKQHDNAKSRKKSQDKQPEKKRHSTASHAVTSLSFLRSTENSIEADLGTPILANHPSKSLR